MSRRFWFHLVLVSVALVIAALSLLEISKKGFFEFQALHLTFVAMLLLVISSVGQGIQEFKKTKNSKSLQKD